MRRRTDLKFKTGILKFNSHCGWAFGIAALEFPG